MRFGNIIEDIAAREARNLRSSRSLSDTDHGEDCDRQEPTGTLSDVCIGPAGTPTRGINHERHENSDRMHIVTRFLDEMVLPYMDKAARAAVRGRYPIELHDTYTYLEDHEVNSGRFHSGALVFARNKEHGCLGLGRSKGNMPVLFPDTAQMKNYMNILRFEDPTLKNGPKGWEAKTASMFFAGSSTGPRDPARNPRIAACLWSLDHRDISEFYITHIVQMDREHALTRIPRLAQCLRETPRVYTQRGLGLPFAPDEHVLYRIGANLPGNTYSWMRVPLVLGSRTVLFDDAFQRDEAWYSPLLQDGVHYVGVDMGVHRTERGDSLWASSTDTPTAHADRDLEHHDLVRKYTQYVNDAKRCSAVADAANTVVQNGMLAPHAAQYVKCLLETAAFLSAP